MKAALKYAVLGLAPIVLVVGIVYTLSNSGNDLAKSIEYYNVLTGDRVTFGVGDEGAGASVMKDDQGRSVLFRLVEDENGNEVIPGRDRVVLTRMIEAGTVSADDLKIDIATFRVRG